MMVRCELRLEVVREIAMEKAIGDSVGRHGRNQRHDVLVVQMLLNNDLFAIGPRPKLNVDGVCGPLTIEAITTYQQRKLSMKPADGVVDPSGRTLKSLLSVASVKHKQLVSQVHQVQKIQSVKLAPVANVTQVAPSAQGGGGHSEGGCWAIPDGWEAGGT